MCGVATEKWPLTKFHTVYMWLKRLYGNQAQGVWFIEQDHDLETLCMREDIYIMYMLKWGNL